MKQPFDHAEIRCHDIMVASIKIFVFERDDQFMMLDPEAYGVELLGILNSNLKLIEEHYNVEINERGGEIFIRGDNAASAETVIKALSEKLMQGDRIDRQMVEYVMGIQADGTLNEDLQSSGDVLCFTYAGKPIKAKTIGQKKYTGLIRDKDMVFGIGPAGTGKTYLAVAMAINAYKNKQVQKIILTRPAVEAGERLGFLPGDMQDKVDPYLRPLYDALYEMLGREVALRLRESEVIEIVPLAYMRGRTLDRAFIILDEAQNTTREQMKMFLTRLGFSSKAVITGDITQIDLPDGKKSGLVEAARVLAGIDEIGFAYLKDVDVVRHPLVKKIINAYGKDTGLE